MLSINLQFEDGATAQRDVVFGGLSRGNRRRSCARRRSSASARGRRVRENCFPHRGQAVTASEVETGEAAVLIVRAGYPPGDQYRRRNRSRRARVAESAFTMPRTSLRYWPIWPVAAGAGNSDLL